MGMKKLADCLDLTGHTFFDYESYYEYKVISKAALPRNWVCQQIIREQDSVGCREPITITFFIRDILSSMLVTMIFDLLNKKEYPEPDKNIEFQSRNTWKYGNRLIDVSILHECPSS